MNCLFCALNLYEGITTQVEVQMLEFEDIEKGIRNIIKKRNCASLGSVSLNSAHSSFTTARPVTSRTRTDT
jgi:hypothetical protein